MDRLLSDEELCNGCPSINSETCEACEYLAGAQDGAKAQDIKTAKAVNEDWVKKIEAIASDCIHGSCKLKCEDSQQFGNWCTAWQQLKKNMEESR